MMGTEDRLRDLRARKARVELAGVARVDAQHNGKMTARERLEMLLDEGSFQEIDAPLNTGAEILTWTRT